MPLGCAVLQMESFPEKLFRIPGIRKAGIVFQDRIYLSWLKQINLYLIFVKIFSSSLL